MQEILCRSHSKRTDFRRHSRHKKNKKEIVEKGVFLKLWDIGVSYNRKEITLHELEKKVEQLK